MFFDVPHSVARKQISIQCASSTQNENEDFLLLVSTPSFELIESLILVARRNNTKNRLCGAMVSAFGC